MSLTDLPPQSSINPLADAYGVPAFKVTSTDGVDDAIRKAQGLGPYLD